MKMRQDKAKGGNKCSKKGTIPGPNTDVCKKGSKGYFGRKL